MKTTFIIILGSLIAFSSCQTKEAKLGEEASTAVAKSDLAMAYVNSDSLAANYLYFAEVNEQLETKRAKFEKEFANRATGLQRQIEDFQKTANNMTMTQGRAVEEDLTRKQQNLQQYQQSLTQELLKEESKLNKELYEKVASFLKNYGKEKELDFIFKYSTGGEIWYGNSMLDITNEIIEGLNTAYNAGDVEVEITEADSTSTE